MEKKEFLQKFAEVLDVEEVDSLTFDTDFRDLEEWSSMATVNLIVFFDEEFGKTITNFDIRGCSSIADLFELLKQK